MQIQLFSIDQWGAVSKYSSVQLNLLFILCATKSGLIVIIMIMIMIICITQGRTAANALERDLW